MADIVDRLSTSRAVYWTALGLSLALAAWIIAAHVSPRRTLAVDPAPVSVVPDGGPCTPDRWELACSRWREQGWPCIVSDVGTAVVVLDLPDARGAHRAGAIGIAPDACGEDDPTPEHELGHALWLPDCPACPVGDVMGTPAPRAGLRIPTRVTP